MFIRVFIDALSDDEALIKYRNINEVIYPEIKNENIKKNELYWKIEGVYVIEAKFEFFEELSEEIINKYLESIADNWQYFGNPVDEALASSSDEDISFIKEGVRMINVFFE